MDEKNDDMFKKCHSMANFKSNTDQINQMILLKTESEEKYREELRGNWNEHVNL